jgi:hypothetical protein
MRSVLRTQNAIGPREESSTRLTGSRVAGPPKDRRSAMACRAEARLRLGRRARNHGACPSTTNSHTQCFHERNSP